MSLTSYIDSLKERPEHHRRRHAFWWAFGITLVMFAFWLSSFASIGIGFKASQTAAAETAGKIVTPGQSLIAGVGDLFGDVWTMITGPKKVKLSEIEARPGKK